MLLHVSKVFSTWWHSVWEIVWQKAVAKWEILAMESATRGIGLVLLFTIILRRVRQTYFFTSFFDALFSLRFYSRKGTHPIFMRTIFPVVVPFFVVVVLLLLLAFLSRNLPQLLSFFYYVYRLLIVTINKQLNRTKTICWDLKLL